MHLISRFSFLALAALALFGPIGCGQRDTTPMSTSASGLRSLDLKEGAGVAAKPGDMLLVHYTGWLKNGKKFDSSRDRGQPFELRLGAGSVIKGWDEGVIGMKLGGKRKLVIPPDLAYGARGQGEIPPNSELTFEIELVKIKDVMGGDANASSDAKVQIEALKEGTGAVVKEGDTVVVHYTGWLQNGTKFDSSLDHGQPFQFTVGLGEVIKGWDKGVAGMKVGGKRKLIIPPELAYGAEGKGGALPPNATLTFDIELLRIK
jgi:peptidylprolyl isomerase